ncbi:MAG: glycosyltransferase [Rhizobacter sp.]|nr:glycosyltransferase [Ferruginibacter sp.]
MKKTIVHVIDSLGRGGAETMLVALLPELNSRYNVILVTLNEDEDFNSEEVKCYKRYRLNCCTKRSMLKAVFRLNSIIKEHKPGFVRTQLFWSTIIGRLATPRGIPFFFSVHSMLTLDAFKSGVFSYWLEKLTYKKRHTLIAVSQVVLEDYKKAVGIKGPAYVINNFIQPVFFEQSYNFAIKESAPVRIVAVGNLKEAKNYPFLLNVVALVKNKMDIRVDIIGEGHLRAGLQEFITNNDLPVNLLGKKNNLYALLPQYDVYIMCSHHEGFGNSPVEAMAVGLPLLLNDSDTMKEMSRGNALFYESNNEDSLAMLLINLKNNCEALNRLSGQGKEISKKYYNRDRYMQQLQNIYDQQQ